MSPPECPTCETCNAVFEEPEAGYWTCRACGERGSGAADADPREIWWRYDGKDGA